MEKLSMKKFGKIRRSMEKNFEILGRHAAYITSQNSLSVVLETAICSEIGQN